jgi:hypothetical protein
VSALPTRPHRDYNVNDGASAPTEENTRQDESLVAATRMLLQRVSATIANTANTATYDDNDESDVLGVPNRTKTKPPHLLGAGSE